MRISLNIYSKRVIPFEASGASMANLYSLRLYKETCKYKNIIKVNNLNTDINAVYNQFDDMDHVWIIDKRLITSEFVTILNNNFNKLVTISLSLVFLILLIAYGRIELAIITMIPIIVSWIWTVGIMGILGIDFNIFNVIIECINQPIKLIPTRSGPKSVKGIIICYICPWAIP